MMNYLVLSDIHGDGAAIDFIQSAIQQHQPDCILCLGDILYHGPRNDLPVQYDPKAVITYLNSLTLPIIAVRGNCDAEVDQMVLHFPITADYNILPLKGRTVFATHGHVYTPDHLPALKEGDCFLYGHTHVPRAEQQNGIYLLNPGSISMPKENHPRTYAVLDKTGFRIHTCDHAEYQTVLF